MVWKQAPESRDTCSHHQQSVGYKHRGSSETESSLCGQQISYCTRTMVSLFLVIYFFNLCVKKMKKKFLSRKFTLKLNQRRRETATKRSRWVAFSRQTAQGSKVSWSTTYLSSCSRAEPGTRPAPSLFPSACRTSGPAPKTPVQRTSRIIHHP